MKCKTRGEIVVFVQSENTVVFPLKEDGMYEIGIN
jgi:hypothetical protein